MNIVDATFEFMLDGDQTDGDPHWVEDRSHVGRKLRERLLDEEYSETCFAEMDSNPVEVADGLADVIVIAVGSLFYYFGEWAARAILDEVARSNLDKVVDGPIFREDGKLLKPEGWVGPQIREILVDAGVVDG